jgi:hypothetical protein
MACSHVCRAHDRRSITHLNVARGSRDGMTGLFPASKPKPVTCPSDVRSSMHHRDRHLATPGSKLAAHYGLPRSRNYGARVSRVCQPLQRPISSGDGRSGGRRRRRGERHFSDLAALRLQTGSAIRFLCARARAACPRKRPRAACESRR